MRILLLALTAIVFTACKPSLLPNTEIEDTDENRAIYDVLTIYRNSMEARNADKVISIISRDFFETNGNEDPSDDYGYKELVTHIRDDLGRTLVLRLDIHLKEISVEEEQAVVTYRYKQRAHVTFPAGDQWVSENEINQMKLKKEKNGWKITAGL